MTKLRAERKKKRRLWPKVMGVFLLLILAGAGYVYYLFELKTYDIADEELSAVTAAPYEVNLSERRYWQDAGEEDVSEEEIQTVYRSSLDEIKATTERRVREVAERALNEYQQLESSENVSVPYLYAKYTQAADQVERQMDEAFEEMYQEMRRDLEQSGGSLSEAQALREDYESYKDGLRRQIMDQAGIGF
ncbi:cell division protein FtsQ/DivIB [Salisediminibacterium selenitireducens]|uniref:Uncharacterized protein n=1 Tax=Bacillus selenitireducens (strain ATCC 700615 / DSM 15326 / MLS10) TaxID=439292 RepID=D6Y0C5_BACIE|nr:hypothetical protein [Salisediminibacterium selenitireducens]ADH98516.1 hypothetical protein Bsel_0995 [[Bacillus] selenitireducens MLS10]